MRVRPATADDHEAILRTWIESGWLEDDEDDRKVFASFRDAATWTVAELPDSPDPTSPVEAATSTMQGSMRYQHRDLPFVVVTSVNAGRVGRGHGLAGGATAVALARAADAGAAVAGLGIFDQGYYDRLGFGTLGPWVTVQFDPALLDLGDLRPRPPVRLSLADVPAIHRALGRRRRVHGSVVLEHVGYWEADLRWGDEDDQGYGLGYRDGDGELTHLLWIVPKGEHGPDTVQLTVFRTGDELRELLALLRVLSDQMRVVRMDEPPGVQIQDVLRTPFRAMFLAKGADRAMDFHSRAWHQARILDVPACVAATTAAADVTFDLHLEDPVTPRLAAVDEVVDRPTWAGVGGRWRVTFGASSSATRLSDGAAVSEGPHLRTTVAAFTRMWLGVRAPSDLALLDPFEASEGLLDRLDAALLLPAPHVDLDF